MEGLKNKVVVLAGAGGLATATARFLGAGGATIVVSDVVEASAEATLRAVRDAGVKASPWSSTSRTRSRSRARSTGR